MKLYLTYFKLRLQTFMQYRTAAIAGLTTQFFWAIMLIFIYYTFYSKGNNIKEITLSQIITYTWLHQAFYSLLTVRQQDLEISKSIKSGNVAYEIIRPYNLYLWWYIKTITKRLSAGLLRFLPIILIGLLLPSPYKLSLPYSTTHFILFLISLILGVLLVSSINMLIYSIGFYTYDESGIRNILNSIIELLAGSLVPVVLLPKIIQNSTYYLPFRLISDLPFRIYSNNINILEGINSIILQIIWIIILTLIGNQIIKKSLNKVFIQGG